MPVLTCLRVDIALQCILPPILYPSSPHWISIILFGLCYLFFSLLHDFNLEENVGLNKKGIAGAGGQAKRLKHFNLKGFNILHRHSKQTPQTR